MEQLELFKVRSRRNKDWFYLDNEYLNGFGKYFGAICVAIYVSLCRHADNETQKCFPSQKLIAEELKISDRTVRDYIKLLEKHKIIQIKKERSGRGKWINNVYYLLDKTEWIYPSETIADGHHRKLTTQPEETDDISHRKPFPTNNTNKNNTNINNTHLPAKAGINRIFDVFYEKINPTLNYAHGGNRKAAEFLAARLGLDGAIRLAEYACSVQSQRFAPVITTPYQLKEKLAQLKIYAEKENNKPKGVIL